jgi:APA family basic amino acid/polyamine antiporter
MKGGQGDPLAQLADAQEAVREALSASYSAGHAPEAMITAAVEPWPEIKRIAEEHACESLLIGLPQKVEPALDRHLEDLMNEVDCDITMMRAPDDWKISGAKRVLVPIAGKSEEAELRARILASLSREAPRELVFLCVLPLAATDDELAAALRTLTKLAAMKLPGTRVIEVVRSDDPTTAILAEAARCDLVVLGMRRSRQGKKQLGSINRAIVARAACAVLLLSTQSQIGVAELTRPIRDVAQLVSRSGSDPSDASR